MKKNSNLVLNSQSESCQNYSSEQIHKPQSVLEFESSVPSSLIGQGPTRQSDKNRFKITTFDLLTNPLR